MMLDWLRPKDTLSPDRIEEIGAAQEDARKSSTRLAESLERIAQNSDDPFEDFARRAREARWRR